MASPQQPQHASPLPPAGWYQSKVDKKTRRDCARVVGNRVEVSAPEVPHGGVVYEECASLTSPVLLDNALANVTDPHVGHSARQLLQLNSTLPALRLPDAVVPLLVHATSLSLDDIRRGIAPLETLSKARSANQQDLMPAFAVSHAMKKVFPKEAHAHLAPAVLGALLTVFVRGALPHTCGGRAGASLFHRSSLIEKASHVRANVRCEAEMVDGRVCVKVVALQRLQAGDVLRLPSHEELWGDIHAVCECGAAMPEVIPQPGKGLPSVAKKLHLPEVASSGIVQTHLPGRGGNGRVAFVLDNVFTKEECDIMSDMAFGSWDSTLQYKQMLKTGPAGNYRLLKTGSDLHGSLWSRIHQYCPKEWNNWKVGDINDRMRFIQYDKGERFVAHTDGEYCINEGSRAGWRSFITVQVYLTEGMQGGSTRFINGDTLICDSVPKVGRVLVFEHCMRHTGEEVTDDTAKRIIRTEIMYQPSRAKYANPANQSLPEGWQEGADGLNLPRDQAHPRRV